MNTVAVKPHLQADTDRLLAASKLSERDILTIAKRIRSSGVETHYNDKGFYMLTDEQNEKGITWLRNQWKSPMGKVRTNNPFGFREEHVIENFDHFEFVEFFDASNYLQSKMGIKCPCPIYRAVAKDGATFEYYLWLGEIQIIG